MVMLGWSVHLPTHFTWARLTKRLTSTLCTYLILLPFLNQRKGGEMAVEIISLSISAKVWDGVGIKLETPGSAVRHIADCAFFSWS